LCGIVRNLANNSARRHHRDLLSNADSLEFNDLTDPGAGEPVEQSIAQEEIDLVDRALESMPDTYRVPLVLFYREQQSVTRVAELLDL